LKKIIIFISVITLFFFIVIELVFRIFVNYTTISTEYYPPHLFIYDDTLGYQLNANFSAIHKKSEFEYKLFTNQLNMFDQYVSIDSLATNSLIFTIGDSYLFGYVDYQSRFGTLLEKLSGIRVLKGGVPGWAPYQYCRFVKRILDKIRPTRLSAIVVGFSVVNDPIDDFYSTRFSPMTVINGNLVNTLNKDNLGNVRILTLEELNKKNIEYEKMSFRRFLLKLRSKSALISFLDIKLKQILPQSLLSKTGILYSSQPDKQQCVYDTTNIIMKQGLEESIRHLAELNRITREFNAQLIIMMIPPREEIDDILFKQYLKHHQIDSLSIDKNYIYNTIEEFCSFNSINFIDLRDTLKLYPITTTYYTYDMHLNAFGQKLCAEMIYNHCFKTIEPAEDTSNQKGL